MSLNSRILLLLPLLIVSFLSCKKDIKQVEPVEHFSTTVKVDLSSVPYDKLSDYGFFTGDLKDEVPANGLVEYEPASMLFTDYAHKKRFVYIPYNQKATYNGDGKVLEFPVGTVLIKNFYYEHILPADEKKILETRLLIKNHNGWMFAEYLWNDAQTEAYLDMNGSTRSITFIDDNSNVQNASYRFPSETECLICHKKSEKAIPIGIKPQNINFERNYDGVMVNQLQKLIDEGMLANNLPANITSTIAYSDVSQSLEMRLRSYLDMNCSHCHSENSHCDYRPLRLAFSETTDEANMGLCVPPDEVIGQGLDNIITPSNPGRSMMHYRLSSTVPSEQMPLLGRSLVHAEAVQLLQDWILSQTDCN